MGDSIYWDPSGVGTSCPCITRGKINKLINSLLPSSCDYNDRSSGGGGDGGGEETICIHFGSTGRPPDYGGGE